MGRNFKATKDEVMNWRITALLELAVHVLLLLVPATHRYCPGASCIERIPDTVKIWAAARKQIIRSYNVGPYFLPRGQPYNIRHRALCTLNY